MSMCGYWLFVFLCSYNQQQRTNNQQNERKMLNKGIDKLYNESKIMADKIKKGSLVRAIREKLEGSLEEQASDSRFPPYIFETKGEVVDTRGDYALIKFGQVPTPNVWLRMEQLEALGAAAATDG
jgi:hypothetical protein